LLHEPVKNVELDALHLRRNPWITALSTLPFLAIPAFWVLNPTLLIIAPHMAIVGMFLAFALWRRKPFAKYDPVRVSITADTLKFGSIEIPRAEITGAQLLSMPGKAPVVRVSVKLRPATDIIVRDEKEAHTLLRALGFDPSQTTATFLGGSLAAVRYRWMFFLVIPVVMAMAFATKAFPWLGPMVGPLVLLSILPIMLWPLSLTVGVDGILLRWMWVREFIPTKSISLVSRFDESSGRSRLRGILLQLDDGRAVKIPIRTDREGEALAIVETRIDEVVALAKSGAHVADDALLFARGDLPFRDWIARLRALGMGATAQLRVAPVMPERLWRVALDPVAPAPARAAAAVALSSSLDEGGRARLAEAAKTTAAPQLRVALETAARGASDEEMEQALSELEAGS
jgi:hypothetical protein